MLSEEGRMSPVIKKSSSPELPATEGPRDFCIKRKMRPVPPPLDLSKRTFDPEPMITDFPAISTLSPSPRSPLTQKNLPLRKRAYSWSYQADAQGLQLPVSQGVIKSCAEVQGIKVEPSLSASSSSLRIPGLPTPQTPHTPHPHSAIPVITSRFNFNENTNGSFGVGGSTQVDESMQGPLNLSMSSVGGLPSSLLSPAPSHPSTSSLSSSREELESEIVAEYHQRMSPHVSSPHISYYNHGANANYSSGLSSVSENLEESNLVSEDSPGHSHSHQWPTTVWSIFMAGVQVYFALGSGGQMTGARLSEELGQLEVTHQKRYAPHGLQLMRILHDGVSGLSPSSASQSIQSHCYLFWRPNGILQENILVFIPSDHPFYVHGKGWCSVLPEKSCKHYGLPCHQLQEGDICLPPDHPETSHGSVAVVTPDLTDAIKRFGFEDEPLDQGPGGAYSAPASATFSPHTQRSVFLSPPASPSKKCVGKTGNVIYNGSVEGNICIRSRRPMNGFMMFAKYHRLRLIQQYPGKDNRAISVLLGGLWKSLPEQERERYNAEARIQAEERKRIDPDCWKRKRSHSTS